MKKVYPYYLVTSPIEQETIETGLSKLSLFDKRSEENLKNIEICLLKTKNKYQVLCKVKIGENKKIIEVPSFYIPENMEDQSLDVDKFFVDFLERNKNFQIFSSHKKLVSDLLIDMMLGCDICLVGDKGEGKSYFLKMFSELLGYQGEKVFIVHLYKDMTSR